MIIELSKRANVVDESLSVFINVSDEIYTLGIYADEIGPMYSYSSTNLEECYSRVSKFIECLTNPKKMDKFMDEVLQGDFEV